MTASFGYRRASDLPRIIPVFPLDGVVLLPRAPLPLNVFEPRYLNMVDDALSSDRLIGIVQVAPGGADEKPHLQSVGSAGRITSFAETRDGRYLITLHGISRYVIEHEHETSCPYRQAKVNFEAFERDLQSQEPSEEFDRAALLNALRAYLEANSMEAEWGSIDSAPPEVLVNSLSMICPFSSAEKQALLEADSIDDRGQALVALLQMGAASGDGPGGVQ